MTRLEFLTAKTSFSYSIEGRGGSKVGNLGQAHGHHVLDFLVLVNPNSLIEKIDKWKGGSYAE